MEDQVFTLKRENAALQLKLNALQGESCTSGLGYIEGSLQPLDTCCVSACGTEKNEMFQTQLSQLMETEEEILRLKSHTGTEKRGLSASQEKKTMMHAMGTQGYPV